MKRYRSTALVIAILLLTIFGKESFLIAEQPIHVQQQKIAEVMSTFFAAADNDEVAKFHSVITPGFYAFDNGARFDGDALMDLVKSMHAAGQRLDWHVTEPDIHINRNIAWIA